jgi:hypothetical protein
MLNPHIGANGCRECMRLWDEFRSLNHNFFELDSRFHPAGYGRKPEIWSLWEESGRKRSELRAEIRAHERGVLCTGSRPGT